MQVTERLNETRECKIRRSFKFRGTFQDGVLHVMEIRMSMGILRVVRADQTITPVDVTTFMIPEAKELQKALVLAVDILKNWNIYEGFLRCNKREID